MKTMVQDIVGAQILLVWIPVRADFAQPDGSILVNRSGGRLDFILHLKSEKKN